MFSFAIPSNLNPDLYFSFIGSMILINSFLIFSMFFSCCKLKKKLSLCCPLNIRRCERNSAYIIAIVLRWCSGGTNAGNSHHVRSARFDEAYISKDDNFAASTCSLTTNELLFYLFRRIQIQRLTPAPAVLAISFVSWAPINNFISRQRTSNYMRIFITPILSFIFSSRCSISLHRISTLW